MDYSAIIVGALALIGTIVGNVIGKSKTVALVTYRMEQLEKKVEMHNNAVLRLTVLENDVKNMKEHLPE